MHSIPSHITQHPIAHRPVTDSTPIHPTWCPAFPRLLNSISSPQPCIHIDSQLAAPSPTGDLSDAPALHTVSRLVHCQPALQHPNKQSCPIPGVLLSDASHPTTWCTASRTAFPDLRHSYLTCILYFVPIPPFPGTSWFHITSTLNPHPRNPAYSGPVSSCTLVYRHAPSCTALHPHVSSCTIMHSPAPSCIVLHPRVSSCTLMYRHAPLYTRPCMHAHKPMPNPIDAFLSGTHLIHTPAHRHGVFRRHHRGKLPVLSITSETRNPSPTHCLCNSLTLCCFLLAP